MVKAVTGHTAWGGACGAWVLVVLGAGAGRGGIIANATSWIAIVKVTGSCTSKCRKGACCVNASSVQTYSRADVICMNPCPRDCTGPATA